MAGPAAGTHKKQPRERNTASSPPSFTFNERKRKGGRRQLGLGQSREQGPVRCKQSPPSLGVCRQSTDDSQLGLERPLTFHGRPSPTQVRHTRLFEVPRTQAVGDPEQSSESVHLSLRCWQEPYFISSLCLFYELREARRPAQGHTASWGQKDLKSKSPSAVLVPPHQACNPALSTPITPPGGKGGTLVQPDSTVGHSHRRSDPPTAQGRDYA